MIRLEDVLDSDAVHEVNLAIYRDPDQTYLRSGPFGDLTPREVEQRIRNVPGQRISRLIRAVGPFDRDSMGPAWSHFVALVAGTHPFPDANHRTAVVAFSEAVERAWGALVGVPAAAAARLVGDSKQLRDGARRARPGRPRFYTVGELASEDHPYRVHFRQFEPVLEVVELGEHE